MALKHALTAFAVDLVLSGMAAALSQPNQEV